MRVIMFHGLGEPPHGATAMETRYWVKPEDFRSIIERIVEFDDYEITFDDGNRSDFDIAMPVLEQHGLTARFFVLSDRLDSDRSLGPAELKAMVDAGMTIGSHGRAHRAWSELSEAELDDELTRSREELSEAAGTEVTMASCPFGRYDAGVLRALRRHGYSRVYTSDGGWASPNAWLVGRTTMHRGEGLEILNDLLRPGPLLAARQQARYCYRRLRFGARGRFRGQPVPPLASSSKPPT